MIAEVFESTMLWASLIMLCLLALSYAPWGRRRKLAIFICAFYVGVAGIEAVVRYAHAFGTDYAAIPLASGNFSEVMATGDVGRVGGIILSDATTFGVLLYAVTPAGCGILWGKSGLLV